MHSEAAQNSGGLALRALHSTAGNGAVARLLGARRLATSRQLQPKLMVGSVNDPLEREADRVAQWVMRNFPTRVAAADALPEEAEVGRVVVERVSRTEERRDPIGLDGGELGSATEAEVRQARSSGAALPPAVRAPMEQAIGADFGGVRVHTGPRADALSRSMQALAFTVGRDIFFARSQFRPGTANGQRLIAHELTHTIQQGATGLHRDARARTRAWVLGTGRPSTVQRNGGSAEQLYTMAKPMVEKGPEVQLQKKLVNRLEGAIRNEGAKKNEGYNQDNLFLGGIEISEIPADSSEDSRLLDSARLVPMKVNSLGRDDFSLVAALDEEFQEPPTVSQMIVRNTLSTMMSANQIEYLRKAGFVGEGWKVLIEVHYYRRRTKAGHQLHKDTLGQTLFVNLNYHTDTPIAGPEYIVNPPSQGAHDAFTEMGGDIRDKDPSLTRGGLPERFRKDMDQVRAQLTAEQEGQVPLVAAPDVPAYGFVAFVDELIHHNTPLIGGRTVTNGSLIFYLNQHHKQDYAAAEAAYKQYESRGWMSTLSSFSSYLPATVGLQPMWEKLLPLLHRKGASTLTKYDRTELMDAGMPSVEVDRLFYEAGSSEFSKVSLPTVVRGTPQPLGLDASRPPLVRQMSDRAIKKQLPADTPGDTRCFFRTWVRAVRV